jgi:carboxyl-terminal processing protease
MRRNNFGKAFALAIALFSCAFTWAQKPITPEARESVLKGLETVVTTKCFVPGVDFSQWPKFLESHRAEIDKAETDVAFSREVNKALHDFGVSHIRLNTPKSATSRQRNMTSGLGMQVKRVDGGLEVTTVYPMGPAGQVGIQVGDLIKQADGKEADLSAVRVEPGKKVTFSVLKKDGTTKDVVLENKEFENRRPEQLTWLDSEAAVLRLFTFSKGYDRKNVETLIKEVEDKKGKYLIIDLRRNGGGLVSNLNHFLSLLAPNDTEVGTFISRATADKFAKEKSSPSNDPLEIAKWDPIKFKTKLRTVEPFTGKIAVLVDRGSASASEICCAALQETRGAKIVGSKSMGAVLASVYGKLPEGFELQYPVSDYVTIKGVRLEGNPRVPDLEVGRSADGKDEAPAKALELLKKD